MNSDFLKDELSVGGDHLVMVLTEDGTIYTIKSVVPEVHEDADGSTTIWLKVEEY